jgi:5-hydroxyisourate hydrolase-like protein (transthyretin family)
MKLVLTFAIACALSTAAVAQTAQSLPDSFGGGKGDGGGGSNARAAQTRVTFKVTAGGPLKNIPIRLYRVSNEDKTERPMATITTKDDGTVERSVPRDERIRVVVERHGYKRYESFFKTRPTQDTFSFTIRLKKN